MSKEKKAKESKKPKYRRGVIWTLDPEVYIRKATKKLEKKMGLTRIGVVDRAVLLLNKWADEHPQEAKKLGEEYHLEMAKKRARRKAK